MYPVAMPSLPLRSCVGGHVCLCHIATLRSAMTGKRTRNVRKNSRISTQVDCLRVADYNERTSFTPTRSCRNRERPWLFPGQGHLFRNSKWSRPRLCKAANPECGRTAPGAPRVQVPRQPEGSYLFTGFIFAAGVASLAVVVSF